MAGLPAALQASLCSQTAEGKVSNFPISSPNAVVFTCTTEATVRTSAESSSPVATVMLSLSFHRTRIVSALQLDSAAQGLLSRSVWCRPRSNVWWESVSSGLFGEEWWKENLRMKKTTFQVLCSELRPYITRQTTHLRQSIEVEQRVAVTLWRLATNIEYRTLSVLFGLGRSTVCTIVNETCQTIAQHLLPKYVHFPQGRQLEEIVEGFERLWGFPQAVGAIDGSHIPILRPRESAADYYNRKGFYSVIMQAVVDYRGRFMDVNIGWPGKCHDARVFVNSSFYLKGNSGSLLPQATRRLSGVDVPLVLLGDPAYPLLPWLMMPFPDNGNTTRPQKTFNYRQSRARMVVENAFGRLKGRWRCLLKRMDNNLSNVSNVVAACVVLHNFCDMQGDGYLAEWGLQEGSTFSTAAASTQSSNSTDARRIRNAIMAHVNST